MTVCPVCGFSPIDQSVCTACGTNYQATTSTIPEDQDTRGNEGGIAEIEPTTERGGFVESKEIFQLESPKLPFGIDHAPIPSKQALLPFGLEYTPKISRE